MNDSILKEVIEDSKWTRWINRWKVETVETVALNSIRDIDLLEKRK